MEAKQLVQMALAYKGMSSSDLARSLDWSPQLLHKRLSVGKFTLEEWEKIGQALGATAGVVFRFDDGKEIK